MLRGARGFVVLDSSPPPHTYLVPFRWGIFFLNVISGLFSFAGWFLRFAPNVTTHVPRCDAVLTSLCSDFYHDQLQTPQVPTPSNPNPDGRCVDYCDCGDVPCGEYLWDHRNDTLRSFLINDIILGPSILGNPAISGLFIDDFWCSDLINGTGNCTDPVQGPTEIDRNSVADMGLSDADVADITWGWLKTMTLAQQAILDHNGYTWSLIPGDDRFPLSLSLLAFEAFECRSLFFSFFFFCLFVISSHSLVLCSCFVSLFFVIPGQDNANALPLSVTPANCASLIRPACNDRNPWDSGPLMFGITPGTDASSACFPSVVFLFCSIGCYVLSLALALLFLSFLPLLFAAPLLCTIADARAVVCARACVCVCARACVCARVCVRAILSCLHTGDIPKLPQLEQDVAAFLLMRGKYAFLGWGVWGMSWPADASFPTHDGGVRNRPELMDTDYGSPLGACHEVSTGVFVRKFTHALVSMDCGNFAANITVLS